MKIISCISVMIITFFANAEKISPEILKAMSKDKTRGYGELYGAKAKECFYVVDQDGKPVEDARITGAFWTGGEMNDYEPVDGLTNTNGEYVAEGKSKYKLRYTVSKDGYYSTNGEVPYVGTRSVPAVKDGKWQPYGTKRTVVLKRIINPMRQKVFPGELHRVYIPIFKEWLGFDLEVFDWVAPYGKGQNKDVLLLFSARKEKYNNFEYHMDVSFTNQLYGGAYKSKKDDFSDFKTPYKANTNKMFQQSFSFVESSKPSLPKVWNFLRNDSCLVFRTRTKVDNEKRLISAHYGIILGDWTFGDKYMIISDGCFNPIPNDTNLEDGYYLRKRIRERKERQKVSSQR